MTEPLDYAVPTTRAPLPLWQRLTLIPLYYLGWAVGCAVWSTYLTILAVNTVRAGLSANVGVVYAALAAGGIAGAMLGYLGRRRRWPQWMIVALGVPATSFAIYAVVDMLRTPRGILWEFFFGLVLILLGGGIGMLLAGLTGLALARRR